MEQPLSLVDMLQQLTPVEEGSLSTLARTLSLKPGGRLHQAFCEVDRAEYFSEVVRSSVRRSCFYRDRPLKFGDEHQSAPFIYAKALSALELEQARPLVCLNVGSGTGYFQALQAHILPEGSTLHGVEINKNLVSQSQVRIYVGAGLEIKYSGDCGTGLEELFLKLLSPQGILVAPIDNSLMKVVLNDKVATIPTTVDPAVLLEHVRFQKIKTLRSLSNEKFTLKPAVWAANFDIHRQYRDDFRDVAFYLHLVYRFGRVNPLLCGKMAAIEQLLVELWREIIQFCSRAWFLDPSLESTATLLPRELVLQWMTEESNIDQCSMSSLPEETLSYNFPDDSDEDFEHGGEEEWEIDEHSYALHYPDEDEMFDEEDDNVDDDF